MKINCQQAFEVIYQTCLHALSYLGYLVTSPPLKHPCIINPEQGELKRGGASLMYPFPLPLIKGKGDKSRRLFEGIGLLNLNKLSAVSPVGLNQRGEVNKQSFWLHF